MEILGNGIEVKMVSVGDGFDTQIKPGVDDEIPSGKESTFENKKEIGSKISCDECDHNFKKKADVDILEQGSSYTEEFASCIKCGRDLYSSNAKVVHVNFVHEDSLFASSYFDQTFEIAKKTAKANGIADDTTSDIFGNITKVDLLHNVSSCNVEHNGGGITKLGSDHNHYKDDGVFGGHDGQYKRKNLNTITRPYLLFLT